MPWQGPPVGAETDPLRRARQLQKSWERLLAEGALGPELPPGGTAALRPTIVDSWRRSLATGLDPTDLLAPIEADEAEVEERWFEHPLGPLTHVLTQQLGKVAEDSGGMVVVTDASGLVLHRVGDDWLKERAAEMNLVEGARYSEAADGTNGIGTALAADRAYQVFAFEHFNERHHQWVCCGAPVHDPVSGQDNRTDRPLEPLEDRASTEPGAGDHGCRDDRAVPHACPARPRRTPAATVQRSHDEAHGSTCRPRRLPARRCRAGALEDIRRSGGWWRGRSGRRVGCRGGVSRAGRGLPPPPSHRAPRSIRPGRGARAY